MSAAPSDELKRFQNLPTQFGPYKVVRQGDSEGAYHALDTRLQRRSVLRIYPSVDTPQFRQRFRQESIALARIDHPNVCTLQECGVIEDMIYLASAYVEGESLARVIASQRVFSHQEVIKLIGTLAMALHHLHLSQIAHLNLEPAKIILKPTGSPVILDPGFANLLRPESSSPQSYKGSGSRGAHYLCPEQVEGRVDLLGPACDVYGLGVILYELLAGHPPFTGEPKAVLGQIRSAKPLPPSRHTAGINPKLEKICLKAIAKNPSARHSSMRELAVELSEVLRDPNFADAPINPHPAQPEEASSPHPQQAPTPTPPPPQTQPSPTRSRGMWNFPTLLAFALTLGMIGLLGVTFVWSPTGTYSEEPEQQPPESATQSGQILSAEGLPIPPGQKLPTHAVHGRQVPRMVWVAVDDFHPFATVKLDPTNKVAGKKLRFLQGCYVVQTHEAEGSSVLLLGKSDGTGTVAEEVYGWIDQNLVIENSSAKRDPGSRAAIKAILVNTPESVAAGNRLFTLEKNLSDLSTELDQQRIPEALLTAFSEKGIRFSDQKRVRVKEPGEGWLVVDPGHPPHLLKVEASPEGYGVEDLISRRAILVEKGDLATDLNAGRIPLLLSNQIRATGRLLTSRARVTGSEGSWTIEDPGFNSLNFLIMKMGEQLIVADGPGQAGVYAAPRKDARRRSIFHLYDHFFVYAMTSDYVLVGSLPNFSELGGSSTIDRVIKGWVPKNRVALWPTREALQWDVSTRQIRKGNPGRIFSSAEDAIAFEAGNLPALDPIFLEGSTSYGPDDPRFPILKMDAEDPARHPTTGNRLFRIFGTAGGQISQEGYVWQCARGTNNKVTQVRRVYLMRESELREVEQMLTGIVGEGKVAPQFVDPVRFVQQVQSTIERLTGEFNSDRSLSEVFLMRHGLRFHSPILRKKPSEIQNVALKEFQQLKLRQYRLRDLLQNVKHGRTVSVIESGTTLEHFVEADWEWVTVRDGGGRNQFQLQTPEGNEKRAIQRYFTLRGDPTWWYWVDVEKELP